MIDEFITINDIPAQQVSFNDETNMASAIKQRSFPPSCGVKVKAFIAIDKEIFLFVTHYESKINPVALNEIVGKEFIEMSDDETFEYLGYEKHFLPLISIYGVTLVIDSSLEHQEKVLFPVSKKEFIFLPLEEVLKYNENVLFKKISE